MNAMSREYVHAQYWHNTVLINTGNVSSVDFNLPYDKKLNLLELGYHTTKEVIPLKLKLILTEAAFKQGLGGHAS